MNEKKKKQAHNHQARDYYEEIIKEFVNSNEIGSKDYILSLLHEIKSYDYLFKKDTITLGELMKLTYSILESLSFLTIKNTLLSENAKQKSNN